MARVGRGAHHGREAEQRRRVIHVRHGAVDHVLVSLRKRRAAQPRRRRADGHVSVLARQVKQHERAVVRRVWVQLRRERAADVVDDGKGRDDERERRGDFVRLARAALAAGPGCRVGRGPTRLHRHRVLAHGDRDAQLHAQLDRDRAHGLKQRQVLARMARRDHPVGRERDVVQLRVDVGREQVGQRLAHGHAHGRGRVGQRQRRALAHGHRLATVAAEGCRRDGHVAHGRLPRANHLVARDLPADGAVTDGDEEVLRRDARHVQHAVERVLEVEAAPPRRVADDERRRGRGHAVHARRLAKQDRHG
eukprot:Unigene10101_Nuclearia_a/m.30831 Unigene10101_Nuclearia_a/g.30831  ORF Unigene10101_Nuclearia_a/g.30831 Unigene10101_Nuclearia_a/m.30831 type:complete len:307 (-) Unigene10101_Nuclearia_a:1648-2568(-)